MKAWAEAFYKSVAWQRCRKNYAASVGGLCERCAKRGLISPGEIVHHKIRLTPANVHEPSVTLAWSNLELLCRECHAKEHGSTERRYQIGADGKVLTSPPIRER